MSQDVHVKIYFRDVISWNEERKLNEAMFAARIMQKAFHDDYEGYLTAKHNYHLKDNVFRTPLNRMRYKN